MSPWYHVASAISIALFFFYGTACLFAGGMVEEFERYGLSRFRRVVGALELLGAIGLGLGYLFLPLSVYSAGGLSLLMLLGLGVRVRVRDSALQMLPALFLLLVNVFIAFEAWNALSTPR